MEQDYSMADFLKEIDNSFRELDRGDIVEGTIVGITDSELVVSLELAQDAVVPKSESGLGAGISLKDGFEIGQKCSAVVTHPNHPNGYIELSIKKALGQVEKATLEAAYREQTDLNVRVMEEIKGGFRVHYGTTQGFMPYSQSGVPRDASYEQLFLGEQAVKVIEFNDKKCLFSRRLVLEAQKEKDKEQRLSTLTEGEVVEGKVSKLMPFGAFVDLGGVDGLIPLSEMGWKRVGEASDVVEVGQKVQVKVRQIDHATGRISLSLKDLIQNPYDALDQSFELGVEALCSVIGVLPFGLKVQMPIGAMGFIHKSELNLSDDNAQLAKKFKIGDTLTAYVIDFDADRKQVVLSCIEQSESDFESYVSQEESTVTLGDLFKAKFDQLKK